MKIYAQMGNVGSEYVTLAPTRICLYPFHERCYVLNVEDRNIYNTVMDVEEDVWDWKPYNTTISEGAFYDIRTGKYVDIDNEENTEIRDEEGDLLDCIKEGWHNYEYQDGVLVNEFFSINRQDGYESQYWD